MAKTSDTPMVYDFDDETRTVVYRPMNDAELAQREIDAKTSIEEHRQHKQEEIERALTASDSMLVKAHIEDEDPKATAAIKKYRAELRSLQEKTKTANAPAELALPELPGSTG